MENETILSPHPQLVGYRELRQVAGFCEFDSGISISEWGILSDAPSVSVPRRLFVLRWTDFVTSDWCEVYSFASEALARAALLVACGESGWELGFRDEERWFGVHRWGKFVSEATT